MTRVNGGVFDVKNLWFNIVNPAAPLTLVTDRGEATFSVGAFIDQVLIEQGKGYTLDLTSYAIFKDVSFLKIVDITLGQAGTGHGKGNLRFDNIELAVMPVPGAGILLLAGLGGFAALRRRQRA
ncbi:PEP-CTERM sorting domain-containing protein [Paracoccus caeni]|uniref:PEP-CTERM sorting domain-containing protein n=1 Tax=Paracoccus caeni TaxID=657651 RepID=A0A934SCM9_9RHOB|nr:PEP-CTERM sorting domain-containing protein [Paracoccus caeni]MBK4215273.1 PEP-CTERM sorting domain-containing protein [Paracoccus caeni]